MNEDNRITKRSVRIDDHLWLALASYAESRNERTSVVVRRAIVNLLESEDWPTRDVPVNKIEARMRAAQKRNAAGKLPDRDRITIVEAARHFDVTRATLYNWYKAGKIVPVSEPGSSGELYFDVEALKIAVSAKRAHVRAPKPGQRAKPTGSATVG